MGRYIGWLALLVVLGGALLAGRPVAGAPATGDNDTDGYLYNGGFEGNFYPVGEGQVAEGWTRVHLFGNPNWMSTQIFANGGWVERIGGENSHILSVEDLPVGQPFETVLYQRVTGLVPGRAYSFSGWILKMYGGSANPEPPADPYSFASWVGVDPTGGTDPTAASVVWGEQDWQTERRGEWRNQALVVVPQGTAATVFVRLWLKWQRAETQAIVDAMELFDAPTVTLHTPGGPLATPHLDWSGTLPPMLADRGNYHLYYDVQQAADGGWATIASDLPDDQAALPLPVGEPVTLRVVPRAYQPEGEPVRWPPTTHVGVPSPPVTVTYGATPAPPPGDIRLFLPLLGQ